MPEELESPVEKIHEELNEAVEHAKEGWLKWSALLSAFLAVMAAIAGLESAHHANDAMIHQIQASDQWGYYQSKGIKGMLIESEDTILKQLKAPVAPDTDAKLSKYHAEQEEIRQRAEGLTEASKADLETHEIYSFTVTLSQVAIVIVAIAVLTRRRTFVLVSLAFGIGGLGFLIKALLM